MDPTVFAFSIVVLLFSVILHEVMHGWVALKFGDHTAERAGRLTLNPIPHIDPIGTILIPALLIFPPLLAGGRPGFIFGWAKPVPVNPFNFRDIKKGELATAAAGVAANFGLALAAALIFHLTTSFSNSLLQSLLATVVYINLLLGVFNLLPIPPLDGSKIVMSYLPAHLETAYRSFEKYGFLILMLLWFVPFGQTTLLGAILGVVLDFGHLVLGV